VGARLERKAAEEPYLPQVGASEAEPGAARLRQTPYEILRTGNREMRTSSETTLVTMSDLPDNEIRDYVASGEPMDKAGAYGIQGYGATLVELVQGDFYTVMGFPLARFVRALRELGFSLPITK